MDYTFLMHYWWCIIAILGGLLVFLLFVQGGQTLLYQIGKTPGEQTILINTLGRKWEFTFTTLVTFGGALFAAFPLFYSTSFGGAYWMWMIILFCFILQAVSYEFRMKKGNLLGKRVYESFLQLNGFGGLIFLGIAVSTFFTGSDFTVSKTNLTNIAHPVISSWNNPLHGLEAIANIQNLVLGLSVLFLARTLAALYFLNSIEEASIIERSRKQVLFNALPFVLLFISYVVQVCLQVSVSYDPETGMFYEKAYGYFHSMLDMPFITALFLIGVILVLTGILVTVFKPGFRKGIWFAGIGTILTVTCLLLFAGWNHTAFYPSNSDIQSSLAIFNASSSFFTLKVMSLVSLIIPFVLLYIFYAWKAMNKNRMTATELENESHSY